MVPFYFHLLRWYSKLSLARCSSVSHKKLDRSSSPHEYHCCSSCSHIFLLLRLALGILKLIYMCRSCCGEKKKINEAMRTNFFSPPREFWNWFHPIKIVKKNERKKSQSIREHWQPLISTTFRNRLLRWRYYTEHQSLLPGAFVLQGEPHPWGAKCFLVCCAETIGIEYSIGW